MHPVMKGSPDVIIPEKNLAIFVHGCFWHACKKCYRKPANNKDFWEEKIRKNIKRDRRNERILKRGGWKVIKIWEHNLRNTKNKGILSNLKWI